MQYKPSKQTRDSALNASNALKFAIHVFVKVALRVLAETTLQNLYFFKLIFLRKYTIFDNPFFLHKVKLVPANQHKHWQYFGISGFTAK
jgi:hypothetical protein